MSKVKKISNSMLLSNVFVIFLLILLVIFLTIMLVNNYIIKNENKEFYTVESRINDVSTSKLSDTDDYETIGWISVQNTSIDLPIIRSKGTFNFPVEKEKYVWVYNGFEKYYNVLNIYGHNIYNLSSNPLKESKDFNRLEAIMGFVYKDVAEKSKYMQLTIDGKDYIYKIFAASFLPESDIRFFPSTEYTEEQKQYQLDLISKSSIYDYDVDVSSDDDYITLSTCTRFFSENKYYYFLIAGRLVRENEDYNDYSVTENNNYNKIKKIMEGDGEDESV